MSLSGVVNDVVVECQLYVNIRNWPFKSSRSQSLEQTGVDRLDQGKRCFVVVESLCLERSSNARCDLSNDVRARLLPAPEMLRPRLFKITHDRL